MATDYDPQYSTSDAMDVHDMAMLTRRSTRSFVEDELDADLRELRQSAEAAKSLDSQLNQSSQYSDMIASAGQHGLSVRTSMNMNMDASTGALSGTTSSRASTVSSSYSSSSTPSSVGGDTTPIDLDGKLALGTSA